MKKKKKALITGGCGFVGSHMVDLLLENDFEVIVVDNLIAGRLSNLDHHKKNNLLSIEEIDILNLKVGMKMLRDIDYVFHFAGIGDIVPSIEKPRLYFNNNVLGTLNILECFRNSNLKKLVYAASSSCYGLAKTPTDENHQIDTEYPYALSKYQGAELVRHWYNVYRLPFNTICIFNAYGTRSKTSGAYGAVFGVFLKQKISNKPFTVVGDGTQKRDFVNVKDVVRAFYMAAISNVIGEVFNVGSGKPQSINYLIELLGGGKKVYLPKRKGEPDITYADISKIKKYLGWKPQIKFETGVMEMINNLEYWSEAPLWEKSSIEEATKIWHKYMN